MSRLTILDQPDKVMEIDKSNMIELCERTPFFCGDAIRRVEKMKLPSNYSTLRNIIVVGMGGSAISGELLRDWLFDQVMVPIQICKDYVLPAYADQKSLVIAVSYSGETEETLSSFLEAVNRNCMVLTISSGGHLQAFSQKLRIPHILIPTGFPPRAAIAYLLFPLIVLMEKLGIIEGVDEEIKEALDILGKVSRENAQCIPLRSNKAKRLASEIKDTIPVIYGFRQYAAVARRLKCQFNENSKVPSKFDVFSELNHNDIVGWEASKNLTQSFSLIFIRDPKEPSEIRQRIELTKQLVSEKVSRVLEIPALGEMKLAKMLSTVCIGDFVSIYLALLNGVDPTPTKTIAYLKEEIMAKLNMMKKLEKEIKKRA